MNILIFGVTGQDGSYLTEHILRTTNDEVYGVARRTSTDRLQNLRMGVGLHHPRFHLLEGDITDMSSIIHCLIRSTPTHIYNMSAQSHVQSSFSQPKLTTDVVYGGVMNLLEALRATKMSPDVTTYQASSSEMFGKSYNEDGGGNKYQNESTRFTPCSPYGIAKLAAHNLCGVYREAYDMDIRCGILFNHESERRGEGFVTKKVVNYIAQLRWVIDNHGFSSRRTDFPRLQLGNLESYRDWGHSSDYMVGIHKFVNTEVSTPDLVFGTGESYSIKDFIHQAFQCADLNWEHHVDYNVAEHMRPSEVDYLRADASLAKKLLGWEPKIDFQQLVDRMVKHALKQGGARWHL